MPWVLEITNVTDFGDIRAVLLYQKSAWCSKKLLTTQKGSIFALNITIVSIKYMQMNAQNSWWPKDHITYQNSNYVNVYIGISLDVPFSGRRGPE